MTQPRILIFANGHLPDYERARTLLLPDDFLLGADGGAHHILALGRTPDLVVGDMDSLEPEVADRLEKEGVKLVRYPRDKNETDLELAIRHALEISPGSILILAALGERLDQTLGNLALLTDVRLSTLDVRLDDGVEEAFFCREQTEVRGSSGDIVSLIPWGEQVEGISTEGLKWPLQGETLHPHQTRGISNELVGELARVSVRSGVLLIVHRRLS